MQIYLLNFFIRSLSVTSFFENFSSNAFGPLFIFVLLFIVSSRGKLNNSTLTLGTKNSILLFLSHCHIRWWSQQDNHSGINETPNCKESSGLQTENYDSWKHMLCHIRPAYCTSFRWHSFYKYRSWTFMSLPTESSKVHLCLFTLALANAIHLSHFYTNLLQFYG